MPTAARLRTLQRWILIAALAMLAGGVLCRLLPSFGDVYASQAPEDNPEQRASGESLFVGPGGTLHKATPITVQQAIQAFSGYVYLPSVHANQPERDVLEMRAAPQSGAQESLGQAKALPAVEEGIDFLDESQRVTIRIQTKERGVNGGRPIRISFLPGQKCVYRDKHACINRFETPDGLKVTLITAHSGVGGEAEAFRYAVEGIGPNGAGLSLKQTKANLTALLGASVSITQGKDSLDGFTLVGTARVPASLLKEYFGLPLPEALALASARDPNFRALLDPSRPLIVVETCGWTMSGETLPKGMKITSASIYLAVFQKTS